MSSTFGGIEIGKRALQAQQKGLEVTGHNISNANNEEYSRQRAVQSATDPYPYPALHNSTGAGQVGTGVEVTKIERIRNQFLDQRIRFEKQDLGKWSIKKKNLKEIETMFNELDKGGLVNTMNEFWNSFQELNNNPESLSVRESVVQKSITLTQQFNHFDRQMRELRGELGTEIEGRVKKFNDYTKRIASLNNQIKAIESDTSKQANDLMDKRDKLLTQLSELADIQYKVTGTNQVNISLNGINLVQGKFQNELQYDTVKTSETSVDGTNYSDITKYNFSVGSNQAQIDSGEIKGLMESREKIQDYKMNKVDRLARNLISQVNQQHRAGYGLGTVNHVESTKEVSDATVGLGYTGQFDVYVDGTNQGTVNVVSGDSLNDIETKINAVSGVNANVNSDNILGVNGTGSKLSLRNTSASGNDNVLRELGIGNGQDFFGGTDSGDIKVLDQIQDHPEQIAAAQKMADNNDDGKNDYAGDGSNALTMTQMRDTAEIAGTNFNDFWQTQTSKLGITINRAERMEKNQEVLVDSLNQKQEEKSGVSLDQEMTKMIKYQHGYSAAAKIISELDKMFRTLNGIIR